MPAKRTKSPGAPGPAGPGPTVRGVCTLALLLHFTCVAVSFTSNAARSQLQSRLLAIFSPYTGLLNIDLNFTPYHLTRASAADVDHVVEYLPADAESEEASEWRRVHARSFGGWESTHRRQRWGRVWSFFRDQDEVTARLARSAAEHLVHRQGVRPKQIRCRKHYLQPWDLVAEGDEEERDANSELYYQTVYSANVLVSDDGEVDIIKISSAREVAPPRKTSEPKDDRDSRS
ncbi:MAG: hypothetical protein QGG36_32215 [Pirellulaceae bacterium]|jgi:hypothetical protein|nr:hypothetical protein [Pirellulaceae bacterium]